MPRRLFIHAPNVHTGGGRSLLYAILASMPDKLEIRMTADERLVLPHNSLPDNKIKRVTPSISGRYGAEKWLRDNVEAGDYVLCFGNLPPIYSLRGHVAVFIQNRLLIDDVKLDEFSLKNRLRMIVERYWLSLRMMNVDEFIVQTRSMHNLLKAQANCKAKISVFPFVLDNEGYDRNISRCVDLSEREFDFLYVASGDPHKNHRRLVKAWCIMADEGIFPSLLLTINQTESQALCNWIDLQAKRHNLNIVNMGYMDYEQVCELYQRVRALIFPSKIESFGLPLIEARQAGLPVVASELDYVRDVLDPDQSFDPDSKVSIARAVKRFLGITVDSVPLLNAANFIESILGQED